MPPPNIEPCGTPHKNVSVTHIPHQTRHPPPHPATHPVMAPSTKLNAHSTPIDDGANDAQPIIDCCLSNDLSCRLGAATSNGPRCGDANRSVQTRHAASLPKDGDGQRCRGADRLHDAWDNADDGTEETDATRRPLRSPGSKGRQRRTDAIAAWRCHGGGASVSCFPTTPPCAGLGCELTFLEKVPSMPGRWPADAPFSDRRLSVVLPLLPPHSNPRGACAGSGPFCPYTHRAPFLDTAPAFSTRDPPPSRPPFPSLSRRPTPARPPFPAPPSPPPSHTRLLVPRPQMFPTLADVRPHFPGLSVRALWKVRAAIAETVRFRPARAIFGAAPRPTAPFRSHDPIIFESTPFLT